MLSNPNPASSDSVGVLKPVQPMHGRPAWVRSTRCRFVDGGFQPGDQAVQRGAVWPWQARRWHHADPQLSKDAFPDIRVRTDSCEIEPLENQFTRLAAVVMTGHAIPVDHLAVRRRVSCGVPGQLSRGRARRAGTCLRVCRVKAHGCGGDERRETQERVRPATACHGHLHSTPPSARRKSAVLACWKNIIVTTIPDAILYGVSPCLFLRFSSAPPSSRNFATVL
jgi:hypothetical protein